MTDSFLAHAYHIGTDGKAESISAEANNGIPKSNSGYTWFHLDSMQSATRGFLEKESDLEPVIIDAMLADETRPRALLRGNGLFITLRAMNLFNAQEPEDMISIRIWIDNKKVITARKRDIKAIHDIVEKIELNDAPRNPCDFLTMITDRLFERMEPFFVDLEDQISKGEAHIVSGHAEEIAEDVAQARKRTAIFIRYVTPQKVVLENLMGAEFKWLKPEHKEHLGESLDRVTRYIEELHEIRDRSLILNDEMNNLHGKRLNEITYIFSVAATIFLPLSFLTGLLGVNLGGVPGTNSDLGFWIFSGICTLIVVIQVKVFKRLKFF